jgi:DGQHR domain-containing protein
VSERLTYDALVANQSPTHHVFTFAAPAADIQRFAVIDRIGRAANGALKGFQRPQVAAHIQEIRNYLRAQDAILPNSIVVAFTRGVRVNGRDRSRLAQVEIDLSDGPPGLVVDGQQRLSALGGLLDKPFEVFVAGLLCEGEEELRRQFILINNTRPLPKSLIYELLPKVSGLPERMSSRARAAALAERLNYEPSSSLRGQIYQHTNPTGVIRDTAIQRVIMNSLSDGAMRELLGLPDGERACFALVSDFYATVQQIWPWAWWDHTPKTSRLVHGAGIVALGYVMEVLFSRGLTGSTDSMANVLAELTPHTAWVQGQTWRFGPDNVRPWNALQNVNHDIRLLAEHLIGHIGAAARP